MDVNSNVLLPDIDECYTPAYPGYLSGCEDGCVNLIPEWDNGHKYECNCYSRPGYKLNPADMHSCIGKRIFV